MKLYKNVNFKLLKDKESINNLPSKQGTIEAGKSAYKCVTDKIIGISKQTRIKAEALHKWLRNCINF